MTLSEMFPDPTGVDDVEVDRNRGAERLATLPLRVCGQLLDDLVECGLAGDIAASGCCDRLEPVQPVEDGRLARRVRGVRPSGRRGDRCCDVHPDDKR